MEMTLPAENLMKSQLPNNISTLPSNIEETPYDFSTVIFIPALLYNVTKPRYKVSENVLQLNHDDTSETFIDLGVIEEYTAVETAYDIIDSYIAKNTSLNGVIVLKEAVNKEYFDKIVKSYENFNIYFKVWIIIMIFLAIYNPPFFPRLASVIGIFMFLCGILGLSIDKKLWKERHRCL